MNTLEYQCLLKAEELIKRGYIKESTEIDVFKLAECIYKLELEKTEKNAKSDEQIVFTDEIVSIEDVGNCETTDISVSGDNLFFCNGILTKNSFGLPATADLMIALISTEQLEKQGQLMVKQLKNRYNDPTKNKRFLIGIDRAKMRLFDVENSAQGHLADSGSSTVAAVPFARPRVASGKTFGAIKT